MTKPTCPHCQATVLSTSQPDPADGNVMREALKECAIRCRYDGDLFRDQGNEMRRDASWRAADMANATLAATPAVGGAREDLLDLADQIERAHALYLNQFGTSNADSLRMELTQLLWDNKGTFAAALRAAAQPASPLRGREEAIARIMQNNMRDKSGCFVSWETCYSAAEAIITSISASPPEQPAAQDQDSSTLMPPRTET